MPTTTSATDTAAAIAVSVVVPTCGRLDLLDRCLDALTRQTLPGARYEVIIVDDEPNHNTLHLVAGWRARTLERGPRLVYVSNAGPHGPAAARNRGWRVAQAAIVAFTDDDTVPAPVWLASGLAAFADHIDALCGKIEMPLPAVPTDYQRDARLLECAEFVTANCFCRKGVLERLDGFDERFTSPWREDSDLHFRLLKINATIARAPEALVVHPVRPAPWGVSLLQIKKVTFDALLYKKHPELYRQKIQGAPRWDYVIVAALLAVLAGWLGNVVWLATLGGAAWITLTFRLCMRRLSGTAKTVSHIAEMIVTSALIPPLAVFWRIAGAIRYRVRFA
ncbi:glycosyltransferase family 2 protein [Massilia terrae]|uniref:Glycosyltransferase n=1 Tax=Massilia terrae TaxID=1811224 RepID=A0ABT2CVC2_9BURK|nr:glycosyltransferase [Massilia terrae]MCS0657907.1 glycosyltransferase [Massilia terrae]